MKPGTSKSPAGSPANRPSVPILEVPANIYWNDTFWNCDWRQEFASYFNNPPEVPADSSADSVIRAVRLALTRLPEEEARIIKEYYVHCRPRREIARRCGLLARQVDLIRNRALRRLRRSLAVFMAEREGIPRSRPEPCPYCDHPEHAAIGRYIENSRPRVAWGILRRRLNRQFELDISSIQPLIRHVRDHTAVAEIFEFFIGKGGRHV